MADTPTALCAWIGGIAAGLEELGLDVDALLRRAGLSRAVLAQRHARIPTSHVVEIWNQAIEASGRPHLGLELSEHLSMSSMPALGTALLSSTSAADACRRIERYFPLVSDAVRFRIRERRNWIEIRLDCRGQGSLVADADIDLVLAALVQFLREFSLGGLQPATVRLRRAAPVDPAAYEEHFACSLRFGQTQNLVRFARSHWQAPMPGADAELGELSDQLLENYLQHWETDPITTQVRAQIVQLLPGGEPDLAQVAQLLSSSTRTLQRRLDAANTSFSGLIKTARQELANSYLSDVQYSLKDVAFLLGFSDQANFSRAFKNWYGIAPGQYRRQLRERQAHW